MSEAAVAGRGRGGRGKSRSVRRECGGMMSLALHTKLHWELSTQNCCLSKVQSLPAAPLFGGRGPSLGRFLWARQPMEELQGLDSSRPAWGGGASWASMWRELCSAGPAVPPRIALAVRQSSSGLPPKAWPQPWQTIYLGYAGCGHPKRQSNLVSSAPIQSHTDGLNRCRETAANELSHMGDYSIAGVAFVQNCREDRARRNHRLPMLPRLHMLCTLINAPKPPRINPPCQLQQQPTRLLGAICRLFRDRYRAAGRVRKTCGQYLHTILSNEQGVLWINTSATISTAPAAKVKPRDK